MSTDLSEPKQRLPNPPKRGGVSSDQTVDPTGLGRLLESWLEQEPSYDEAVACELAGLEDIDLLIREPHEARD